jgi:hypothetical protein
MFHVRGRACLGYMEGKTQSVEVRFRLSKNIVQHVSEKEGYFSNSQCIITIDNETQNDWFFHSPGDKTYETMNEEWKHSFLT